MVFRKKLLQSLRMQQMVSILSVTLKVNTMAHRPLILSLSLTSPSSTLPHSSISSLSHPGGLVCRGFLEAFPDHNVKTFISLSSPQAGQFGGKIAFIAQPTAVHKGFTTITDTEYLKYLFPNFTRDNLYLWVDKCTIHNIHQTRHRFLAITDIV